MGFYPIHLYFGPMHPRDDYNEGKDEAEKAKTLKTLPPPGYSNSINERTMNFYKRNKARGGDFFWGNHEATKVERAIPFDKIHLLPTSLIATPVNMTATVSDMICERHGDWKDKKRKASGFRKCLSWTIGTVVGVPLGVAVGAVRAPYLWIKTEASEMATGNTQYYKTPIGYPFD